MRRGTLGLLVSLGVVMSSCTTTPAHLTVPQLVRGERVPSPDNPRFGHLPPSAMLLEAVVTDVRLEPRLLVELSDSGGTEHAWFADFREPPARGDEVWTAVVGPPAEDEIVGVVYPSAGVVAEPETRVSEEVSLAIAVAAVAAGVLTAVFAATVISRRAWRRRCARCSRRAAPGWLTCPYCGASMSPEGFTPRTPLSESDVDVPAPLAADPVSSAPSRETSAQTRIIPPEPSLE